MQRNATAANGKSADSKFVPRASEMRSAPSPVFTRVSPTNLPENDQNITLGLDKFFASSRDPQPKEMATLDIDLDAILCEKMIFLPRKPIALKKRTVTSNSKVLIDTGTTNKKTKIDNIQQDVKKTPNNKITEITDKNVREALTSAKCALKMKNIACPFPDVMLIQIRGTKKIDVRLVAPFLKTINEEGCFLVVTRLKLFRYDGLNSNILERNKATRFCNTVTSTNSLFCTAKKAIELCDYKVELSTVLGKEDSEGRGDTKCENFEKSAAQLNSVFRVFGKGVELIQRNEILSASILNPNETLIFDFTSEIYIWTGRDAEKADREFATTVVNEWLNEPVKTPKLLFVLGYNFTGEKRPQWVLFRHVYQNVQDPLFTFKFDDYKESKFLTIQTPIEKKTPKATAKLENADNSVEDLVQRLRDSEPVEPVLTLENHAIRRDMKDIITEDRAFWTLVDENIVEIDSTNIFMSTKCYVMRWKYRIQVSGIRRMKNGKEASRETGRTRIAYFFWLGSRTLPKQHGLCALRLRDIDKDKSPHIRVEQGNEPSVFLALFEGNFIAKDDDNTSGLFAVLGGTDAEAHLCQVEPQQPLRSTAVYLSVDKTISIIAGAYCAVENVRSALSLADRYKSSNEIMCSEDVETVIEGDDKNLEWVRSDGRTAAAKMFRVFENDFEQLAHLHDHPKCAFTFAQKVLADSVIVDVGDALWLWVEQTPTTFLLQVAQKFWEGRKGDARVVQKGAEPYAFKSLFLQWEDWKELTVTAPVTPSRKLPEILAERRRTFTPRELRNRAELPEGMNLKNLEEHLCDEDFVETFRMDRENFHSLPLWKQIELRKQAGLF